MLERRLWYIFVNFDYVKVYETLERLGLLDYLTGDELNELLIPQTFRSRKIAILDDLFNLSIPLLRDSD